MAHRKGRASEDVPMETLDGFPPEDYDNDGLDREGNVNGEDPRSGLRSRPVPTTQPNGITSRPPSSLSRGADHNPPATSYGSRPRSTSSSQSDFYRNRPRPTSPTANQGDGDFYTSHQPPSPTTTANHHVGMIGVKHAPRRPSPDSDREVRSISPGSMSPSVATPTSPDSVPSVIVPPAPTLRHRYVGMGKGRADLMTRQKGLHLLSNAVDEHPDDDSSSFFAKVSFITFLRVTRALVYGCVLRDDNYCS